MDARVRRGVVARDAMMPAVSIEARVTLIVLVASLLIVLS
jgi:hypothetical protein